MRKEEREMDEVGKLAEAKKKCFGRKIRKLRRRWRRERRNNNKDMKFYEVDKVEAKKKVEEDGQ